MKEQTLFLAIKAATFSTQMRFQIQTKIFSRKVRHTQIFLSVLTKLKNKMKNKMKLQIFSTATVTNPQIRSKNCKMFYKKVKFCKKK